MAEWSDNESFGSLDEPGAESPEAADFLGGRGFNTGFFGLGGARPSTAAAASLASAQRPAVQPWATTAASRQDPPTGPFSGLIDLQSQLRSMQDQLRIMRADDVGLGSPGSGADAWDDIEDEIEQAVREMDARQLPPAPPPGVDGLFGPTENLSRLLSRMLGLDERSGGSGGGGALWGGADDDASHAAWMLHLGFPTAVDRDRHAALAAEGIPAGRMDPPGQQADPPPGSSMPSLARLLGMGVVDFGLPDRGVRLRESVLIPNPRPASRVWVPPARGRGVAYRGTEPGGGFNQVDWNAAGMPLLVPEDDVDSLADFGTPSVTSGEYSSDSEAARRRPGQRRRVGASAPGAAGAAAGRAAGRGAASDDEPPELVDEPGSSSDESPPRLRAVPAGRRAAAAAAAAPGPSQRHGRWRAPGPRGGLRRQGHRGAPAAAGPGSDGDGPPPLVSDDATSSESDVGDDWSLPARHSLHSRGFNAALVGASVGSSSSTAAAGPLRYAARRARAPSDDEPPPLELATDSSDSEGSNWAAPRAWGQRQPASGAARRPAQGGPRAPARRERRPAFFGQLPGLQGRQLPPELLQRQQGQQRPARPRAPPSDDEPPSLASSNSDSDRLPELLSSDSESSSVSSRGRGPWPRSLPAGGAVGQTLRQGGAAGGNEDEALPGLETDSEEESGRSSGGSASGSAEDQAGSLPALLSDAEDEGMDGTTAARETGGGPAAAGAEPGSDAGAFIPLPIPLPGYTLPAAAATRRRAVGAADGLQPGLAAAELDEAAGSAAREGPSPAGAPLRPASPAAALAITAEGGNDGRRSAGGAAPAGPPGVGRGPSQPALAPLQPAQKPTALAAQGVHQAGSTDVGGSSGSNLQQQQQQQQAGLSAPLQRSGGSDAVVSSPLEGLEVDSEADDLGPQKQAQQAQQQEQTQQGTPRAPARESLVGRMLGLARWVSGSRPRQAEG